MPLPALMDAARALLRAGHDTYAGWLLEDQVARAGAPEAAGQALTVLRHGDVREALAILDAAAEATP